MSFLFHGGPAFVGVLFLLVSEKIHLLCGGKALDVYFPARKPRGEAGILAVPADCQRQFVVGNDGYGALFVRLRHGNDGRGRKCLCDKFEGIFAPKNNIDLFSAEFLDDGVYSRTLIAHAGADGIDAVIVGTDRHFRAVSRFSGNRLDFHDSLRDLGHLLFKQFLDEPGRGAGYENL